MSPDGMFVPKSTECYRDVNLILCRWHAGSCLHFHVAVTWSVYEITVCFEMNQNIQEVKYDERLFNVDKTKQRANFRHNKATNGQTRYKTR